MSSEPWTIERIRDALGSPALAQRFLAEINKAPAHELMHTFAKWERIARDTRAALDRADEIVGCEARGEEPSGDWVDGSDRLRRAVARFRTQGAA